jgi:hypothetical protein
MASCPNCGRRTMRTKDWVCQWCGYPLLGGGYKQLDKTYKEFQQERNPAWKSVVPEPEPQFEFEPEEEAAPEPEPPWKRQQPPRPAYQMKPEPEPEHEPEEEYELGPEPKAEYEPGPEPAPQPPPAAAHPEPPPEPQPGPELLARPEPEPVLLPKVEPSAPPALPRQEVSAEPLTVPSLDSIKDGSELTIDQIDALFRADSVGANTALRDKTLVIKGMVNKVFIRDHLDIRYMILNGTRKGLWGVRCGFGKESSPQMSRLSEGQTIALRGRYDGYSKNIIFKDCVLVG